jgi:hypothetical protein
MIASAEMLLLGPLRLRLPAQHPEMLADAALIQLDSPLPAAVANLSVRCSRPTTIVASTPQTSAGLPSAPALLRWDALPEALRATASLLTAGATLDEPRGERLLLLLPAAHAAGRQQSRTERARSLAACMPVLAWAPTEPGQRAPLPVPLRMAGSTGWADRGGSDSHGCGLGRLQGPAARAALRELARGVQREPWRVDARPRLGGGGGGSAQAALLQEDEAAGSSATSSDESNQEEAPPARPRPAPRTAAH